VDYLAEPMVATAPPPDLVLSPINGEKSRSLSQWVTTFTLVIVPVDPFTNESAWVLETAGRILTNFEQADCRVGWLVTGTAEEAREFLGPWANELLTFADPDREAVKALDLQRLPAIVHIGLDCTVINSAEGWEPLEWRAVTDHLAKVMMWSKPMVPAPGDPAPFPGSPALGG
jgi:hypothetical protein